MRKGPCKSHHVT